MIHATANRERIDAAIAACADHLKPILIAVRDYGIAFGVVDQRAQPFELPDNGPPAVMVICDDMHASLGPTGFPKASLHRLIRACDAFAVISSEAVPCIYGAAAALAVAGKRVMLIETRPEHEIPWTKLVQRLAPGRPLLISTVEGGRA